MFQEKLEVFVNKLDFRGPLLSNLKFDIKMIKRNLPILPPLVEFVDLPNSDKIKQYIKTLEVKKDIFICKINNISVKGIECLACFQIGPAIYMDITSLNIKAICPIDVLNAKDLSILSDQYDQESFLKLKLKEIIILPLNDPFFVMAQYDNLEMLSVLDINFYLNLFDTNFEKIGNLIDQENIDKLECPIDLLKKSTSFNNLNCYLNMLKFTNLSFKNYDKVNYNIAYTFDEDFTKCVIPPYYNFAAILSKKHAEHWADDVVKRGIEFFKETKYMEANQCLNKALVIDPTNVNALVTKGALYCALLKFQKALEFFEEAVTYEPTHKNARQYLHQTYLNQGQMLEKDYWNEAILDINQQAAVHESFDPKNIDDKKRYDLTSITKEGKDDLLFVRFYKRALKYAEVPAEYLPPPPSSDGNYDTDYDLTTVIDDEKSEIEGSVEWLIKSLVFYSTLEETNQMRKSNNTLKGGSLRRKSPKLKKRKRRSHRNRSKSFSSSASTFSSSSATFSSSKSSESSTSSPIKSKSTFSSYSSSSASSISNKSQTTNYNYENQNERKKNDNRSKRKKHSSIKNLITPPCPSILNQKHQPPIIDPNVTLNDMENFLQHLKQQKAKK